MTALADFQQFIADQESASLFKKWAQANPGELGRWNTVKSEVLSLQPVLIPEMTTSEGKALMDAVRLEVDFHSLEPTPAPTPTPKATSPARDDKRAMHITSLVSTGYDYSLPSPGVNDSVQSVNGSTDWAHSFGGTFSALQFTNSLYVDGDEPARKDGDIWLAADPVYGAIYHVACGKHSHGPFTNHIADDTNQLFWRCHTSVLSYDRPMVTDQGPASQDSYAFATRFADGWAGSFADWSLFTELGYPTIQNPPFLLGLYGGSVKGEIHCGAMTGSYPNYQYADYESFDTGLQYSSIVGKWVDWLIDIFWSSQGNGSMVVKSRCKANGETGFTTRWQKTGFSTWQWIAGGNSVANGQLVHDIFGIYEGWQSSKAYHDGTFPRHDLDLAGWDRCPTEADALTYLPQ
jgi:hypothetical protein